MCRALGQEPWQSKKELPSPRCRSLISCTDWRLRFEKCGLLGRSFYSVSWICTLKIGRISTLTSILSGGGSSTKSRTCPWGMLGSKITPDLLPQLGQLFPLMLCGLLWRLMGVSLGILLTCSSRERTQSVLPDTLFCFLCTLPRATIQGALGSKPNKLHFFGASAICSFIFTAAQLYILCYSVTGMILLHTIGPMLLLWSQDQQPETRNQRSQQLVGTEEVESAGLLKQATSDRASMASSQASGKLACFWYLPWKARERIGCHVSILFSSCGNY